ncbi:MAG: RNA-binding S4 domain-containing protein [Neisseriaceae bacterium]
MRLDKWLWAARFFKSRELAQKQIKLGRVKVNGQNAKSSRSIIVGDLIEITSNGLLYKLTVRALIQKRGPASQAQQMYQEDEETLKARTLLKWQNSLNVAYQSNTHQDGRPTKKDRRLLEQLKWKSQE